MQARISKPVKSTMQSGTAKDQWILEFISTKKYIEPLMGRTSTKETQGEIRLEFNSKEEAINFAQKKNYSFEIIEPKPHKLIKKSYANNFK